MINFIIQDFLNWMIQENIIIKNNILTILSQEDCLKDLEEEDKKRKIKEEEKNKKKF